MTQYVVELEATVLALAGAPQEEQERRTDALLLALEGMASNGAYGIEAPAAWGGLGGKLGGRFYLEADSASAALEHGLRVMTDALGQVGCSSFGWIRMLAEPADQEPPADTDAREEEGQRGRAR